MSWFNKPHTWDDLKKENEELRLKLDESEHKVKCLTSDLEIANKLVTAEVEIAVNVEKSKKKEEILNAELKLQEDYYQKASKNLEEIVIKGSQQTKFVQELALAMIAKSPNVKQINN